MVSALQVALKLADLAVVVRVVADLVPVQAAASVVAASAADDSAEGVASLEPDAGGAEDSAAATPIHLETHGATGVASTTAISQ